MYTLDINFLNDRPDLLAQEVRRASSASGQQIDKKPIIIGAGVALALNALVGGAWFIFAQQNSALQEELTVLTNTLDSKGQQVQALDKINAETEQTTKEADALATVFNQIKPWSALTLELGELMQVSGVRITTIEQTEPEPVAAAAPAAAPPPGSPAPAAAPATPETAKLVISGLANSFTQINDFLLLLNQSPFFDAENTKLISAELKDNATQLVSTSNQNADGGTAKPQLQPVVEYKIETNLSTANASELLSELEKNGAAGLVNRIKTLQQQGVIKQ